MRCRPVSAGLMFLAALIAAEPQAALGQNDSQPPAKKSQPHAPPPKKGSATARPRGVTSPSGLDAERSRFATGAETTKPRQPKPAPRPTFETVKGAVARHFKALKHYEAGDLISRGDVEPLFDELAHLGWEVGDRKEILDHLLSDDAELTRALRAPANRAFMRHVGQVPHGGGYDRLDRLSQMQDGKLIINRLMEQPGGWNLVEIMSDSREAPGMAHAFSMGPGGKNFEKPTGRIYTEDQLLARLKQSYGKGSR